MGKVKVLFKFALLSQKSRSKLWCQQKRLLLGNMHAKFQSLNCWTVFFYCQKLKIWPFRS